jgi:hypothetical protein
MYSGQSFTSCGRTVDGGHFLRIGDVGTRSTVVGADGWRLASGPKFLDIWLENQKANSALSTAPSSRSPKPAKVPSEDLRIKPWDSPKEGTTQSSLRPLMNADTSWLSSSFPVNALRQQQPNNDCHFWPKPWSSSGIRHRLGRTSRPHREQWRFDLHPAMFQPNQPPMVRFGVLQETTLSRKHLPTHQVLAPRGDPLGEARFHFYRLRYYRVLNRLHSSEINQHARTRWN